MLNFFLKSIVETHFKGKIIYHCEYIQFMRKYKEHTSFHMTQDLDFGLHLDYAVADAKRILKTFDIEEGGMLKSAPLNEDSEMDMLLKGISNMKVE